MLPLLALALSVFVVYTSFRIVRNVFFHPLSRYPGPWMFAASRLMHTYHILKGDLPYVVLRLHERYGPVVRIAPTELAFNSAGAWRDIYGYQDHRRQNAKDEFTYTVKEPNTPDNLLIADDVDHARMRNHLAHAFTSRALADQQPIIDGYIRTMIEKLKQRSREGPQDMVAWSAWCAFDIVGDLTFGESFHCLRDERYHPWVQCIVAGIRTGSWLNQMHRYGLLGLVSRLIPASLRRQRDDMLKYSRAHVEKRLSAGEIPGKPDFLTCMLRATRKGETGMTSEEIHVNAEVLVVAGSETVSTSLAGLIFLLTTHPEQLDRACQEVRSAFSSDDASEMNYLTVSESLPFMLACIREAWRCYPPAPSGMARKITEEHQTVDGFYVPPITSVSIFQWAANRSMHNWTMSDQFKPERWMTNDNTGTSFEADRRDCMNTFSYGPRSCIGKSLAEMEIRLTLARLLWTFDMVLEPGQERWLESQSSFLVWEKPPLRVALSARDPL